MILTFKSGKSAGKSLEQVAVENYPRFAWLLKNGQLPDFWKERMNAIAYALDNFTSKVNCANCKKSPAKLISIAESSPFSPYKDISISTAYVYCSNECYISDPSAIATIEGKTIAYPIKYSKIFSAFVDYPRGIKKEIHEVMYKLLAGDMRKTKENLYELINSILEEKITETPKRKKEIRQLNLF